VITTDISIEEYCKIFDSGVRCLSLLNLDRGIFDTNSRRIEKLKAIGTARKMRINKTSDLEVLSSSKLPWYKDSSNKRVEWSDIDCIKLKIKERAEIFMLNQMGNKMTEYLDSIEDEEIEKWVENLKNGLTGNIPIISINDLSIKQRLILDGVHRFVALYYLYLENEETLSKLLDSDYGIFFIEFESPVGGVFCPWDFMNILSPLAVDK